MMRFSVFFAGDPRLLPSNLLADSPSYTGWHHPWNKIEQHRNNAAKSFVVTGIATDLDRSEDDLMRNAVVQEEISAKQGNPKIWTPTLSAAIHSVMMKPVTMISQFLLS